MALLYWRYHKAVFTVFACIACFLAPLAFSFDFTSFLHAKEAVLVAALVLMSFLAYGMWPQIRAGVTKLAPLWIWVALSTLQMLVSPPASQTLNAVGLVRWTLALILVSYMFAVKCKLLLKWCAASTVAVAVLGLVQYVDLLPWLFPKFDNYTQRMYSVFGNQDLFGGYLALGMPLLFWYCLRDRRGITYAATTVVVVALLLSGSRSSWLAAFAGIVVLVVAGRRRFLLRPIMITLSTIALAALLAVLLVPQATSARVANTLGERDDGYHSRMAMWRAGLAMFIDAPLLGVSIGNYAYWSPRYVGSFLCHQDKAPAFDVERHADQPHCELVRIAAETGLVGMSCWLWFLMRLARNAHCGESEDKTALWGIIGSCAVFSMFNGLFDSIPHLLIALLAAAGLMGKNTLYSERHAFFPHAALVAVTLAICILEIWIILIPSYKQRAADAAQLQGQPCLYLYQQAVARQWARPEAYKHYGFALASLRDDRSAIQAFKQALVQSDTGDLYLVLSILTLQAGDTNAAQKWASECLKRWPNHKDALQVLFLAKGK